MGYSAAIRKPVVLIVEDEPLLRMMAVDLVEDAGFEALEASNAKDAVAILERRSDITILFTDIEMPGDMNGLSLAAAVRDRWPPVKIIVTSGRYALPDIDMPSGSLFFGKPYDERKLVAAIHEFAGA